MVGNTPTVVIYESQNPFSRVHLPMNFYKNKNMTLLSIDDLSGNPLSITDEKNFTGIECRSHISVER